ncbi:MAG: potassium efflux system protein [Arenicella sp.]|jgi:potassium efflux system protein
MLGCIVCVTASFAQDPENSPPPTPRLDSLQSSWWAFFEGAREEVEPRVEGFLKDISTQIAEREPQNREFAASTLSAVGDNLNALLALSDDTELAPENLTPVAESYSIDELRGLATRERGARAAAAEEQLVVSREKRVLNNTRRYRDAVFDDYVAADSAESRWIAGLRLLEARTAQAISDRRLRLLTLRSERAEALALAITTRREFAIDRLATTTEAANLDQIIERIDTDIASVIAAEEELRAAQISASGLDLDTAEGRSQQRLQQDELVVAEINLAMVQVALATSQVERWWVELFLSMTRVGSQLENQALQWSELVRSVEQRAPEWKALTEAELLAVQSTPREGLKRSERRLLDLRLSTAKALLVEFGELNAAIADLKLLMRAVDITAARSTGAIRAWLSGLSRTIKTAYIRASDMASITLFSVSETPVAGTDILRALTILLVAFLLSRGTRHALRRVSDREHGGAKASLYTLGRLSHYAIIILGLFIALSSMGLEFGNIAIVAGALSVGIGFGLQSIVNNFVSGLIILFEHTLRVGDYIELDTGLTGTVKSINVRSTLINTNDNIDIVVPNSEFVTTRLTNWTLGERILRIRIPFGVAYGSDKELVRKAAIEAADEVPFTLTHMKNRSPEVWLTEFGDNSLNFLLLVWVNRMGARRPTRARAAYLWELETKLTEYGIEIPFPQRDLHLRSGWSETVMPNAKNGEQVD